MSPSPTAIRHRRKRARRQRHLDRYKLSKGCVDCGYNADPRALHWDHRDPSDKSYTIGQMVISNLKTLFKEIRKCDIRCANCHAIRTIKEKHIPALWRQHD